jgi:fatty-acid desaturase
MNELIYILVMTHITSVFFSLYIHRGMAHQQFVIHPVLGWIMRVWLWLTDGTSPIEWSAIHHDHHRYSDKPGDPHYQFVSGTRWKRIKFTGEIAFKAIVHGYKNFASKEDIKRYASHVPYGWPEKYQRFGIILLLLINLYLFDYWGLLVWIIQISWMTVWFTVIVAVGAHHFGYQNAGSTDNSRNLLPIGIIVIGEELHNNHHTNPGNPNLRTCWFEFDLGYIYMKIFEFFGLLRFNK